jgi:hypothetical protein
MAEAIPTLIFCNSSCSCGVCIDGWIIVVADAVVIVTSAGCSGYWSCVCAGGLISCGGRNVRSRRLSVEAGWASGYSEVSFLKLFPSIPFFNFLFHFLYYMTSNHFLVNSRRGAALPTLFL